jgi:translation initiation factor 4E
MSHPLQTPWSLYFQQACPGNDDYSTSIHKFGKFDSVEGFWAIFSHLKRPSDIHLQIEYHLFRSDIRGMWEDDVNCHGGKWILFVKKQYSNPYWERAVLSLIGEQIHEDVVGTVLSLRGTANFLSFWTKGSRTASNDHILNDIAASVAKALELPTGTRMKFKNHAEATKDSRKRLLLYTVKAPQSQARRAQKPPKNQPKS